MYVDYMEGCTGSLLIVQFVLDSDQLTLRYIVHTNAAVQTNAAVYTLSRVAGKAPKAQRWQAPYYPSKLNKKHWLENHNIKSCHSNMQILTDMTDDITLTADSLIIGAAGGYPSATVSQHHYDSFQVYPGRR